MCSWKAHLDEVVGEILYDEATLQKRVSELADEITSYYQPLSGELVVISILRGSVLFTSDLIRQIELPLTIDFMALSSYGAGSKTSGQVKIFKDISDFIEGKHALVVEDIVDTGLTLQYLMDLLKLQKPLSVKICTLFDKPSRRQNDLSADFIGFEIPNKFVVGYGLDYDGQYRHLPYVGALKPEVYTK